MTIHVTEQDFRLPVLAGHRNLITYFSEAITGAMPREAIPLRFSVTETTQNHYHCEVSCLIGAQDSGYPVPDSIFRFCRRRVVRSDSFNVVFVVPTGIGAEIGGHVGDATPAARLLGQVCDTLITHPNVVNAADLNEMPENSLYVEGSVLSRLLMGTVGLQPTRANRLLLVVEELSNGKILNYSLNALNAARASCGYHCQEIVRISPPFTMEAMFTVSGRAAGRIGNLERLFAALTHYLHDFDAVALSSFIEYPRDGVISYYAGSDDSVNPWGGVEAMLTHTVSSVFNVPSAHSPMMSDISLSVGVGHPTMAAELVSAAYLQCILKGLHRSPTLVTSPEGMSQHGVITASDVSCLIMPERCFGIQTLAALEQNIPVVLVRDKVNRLHNDLTVLPWARGQLNFAENYFEAAGMIAAMRGGVSPETLRRPLRKTHEVLWAGER